MKQRLIQNQAGFASIVEVIIAAIIFTVAAFGIFTSIASMRPEGADSSEKLEAALMAKGKLEEFRRALSPDSWNNGDLSIGTNKTVTENGYTYTWTVSDGGAMDDYVRRVDLTITY